MTGPTHRKLPGPIDLPAAAAEAKRRFGNLPGGMVLIGGVALQAYGHTRTTKDVDFAVTRMGSAEAERRAREQGLSTTPIRVGGVSVDLGEVTLDFIDRRFEVEKLFQEAISAAERAHSRVEAAEGAEILVVPLEYLVALKMVPLRPLDEADLAFLLTTKDLDYSQARDIVSRHLGGFAARYLDRAARLAGRTDVRPEYES